jgi:hypothetical protein
MRLLVLNHYFDQDIRTLQEAGGDAVQWRVWPYGPLRWEALRVFPDRVAGSLEAFAADDMTDRRREFAAVFERLLHEQFMRLAFDAFVVPSDIFFYVRSAPDACHRLGVPFFVAQKETTIAEYTMTEFSIQVARYAPPLHDYMTVCSERHKEYSLRTGADPNTITVTGQPRFDFYARLPERPAGRTILFLSYHVGAYHRDEGIRPVWQTLHSETEAALERLAREGWRVLVKPHPQQPPPSLRPGLELLPGSADTRDLIVDADVVVGFQTTALFEAMLARKPVLYTAWDPESVRLGADLIPFADWDDAITVLRSPDDLVPAVRAAAAPDDAAMAVRREKVAEFLGPVDGGASERTLEVIQRVVNEFAEARTPEMNALRERLARQRPPARLGRRALMKFDGARSLVRDRMTRRSA